MYIKIDNLKFHGVSPYFRIGDRSKFGPSTTVHRTTPKDFSGKLTELISRRSKLSKPAQRILKVLIENNLGNNDTQSPIEVNPYELIKESGYKNIASVYSAVGTLCKKGILSMSDKRGRKGTIMVYANPLIFGRDRVIVGDIVELTS